jgi:cytosine/creatinine deaminase
MLVLARQRDETIVIFDDILVTVVDIRGDKVRLGITAPKNVPVDRKELFEAKRQESQAAADIHGPHPLLGAAVEEARLSLKEGGLPIGAVLVRGDQIIGRGHDRRVQRGDPISHAEIDCLTNAGRQATYKDTVLYCTRMPGMLGGGAIAQLGIPRVIVGDSASFKGAAHLLFRQGVKFVDLGDAACAAMAAEYIKLHPDLWNDGNAK